MRSRNACSPPPSRPRAFARKLRVSDRAWATQGRGRPPGGVSKGTVYLTLSKEGATADCRVATSSRADRHIGLNIMLMGLKAPLKKGERFTIILTFDQAGSFEVKVIVEQPGTMAPGP